MAKLNKDFTPFPTTKYIGPQYFCNRKEELKKLKSAVKNDRPIVLFSMRRMGKTGLIKHLQYHLSKSRKYICIYVDILNTSSDEEFVTKLVNASIGALNNSKNNFIPNILKTFSRFTPKLTVDPSTGTPGIELNIKNKSDVKMSLVSLFDLIDFQSKNIQIAIDEFQQIANYETPSNMAATIREHMQAATNVHFLFSGSQRHLLLDLFNNPKQPLFRMVDQLILHEIGFGKYQDFIINKFKDEGRIIDEIVVHNLLNWTRQHTFYVQVVCNKLFSIPKKHIKEYDFNQIKSAIKKELEMNFLAYKKLLSKNQYKTLKGIAIERSVRSVRTKHFTNTYKLAASTANQALKYLVEAEIVYEKLTKEGSEYIVYDLFFNRWLQEES